MPKVLYSVLFRFGHIRRSDQCAVYILYSKISTDPGLPLKIRHSHRFVAVVIQFLIPFSLNRWRPLNLHEMSASALQQPVGFHCAFPLERKVKRKRCG